MSAGATTETVAVYLALGSNIRPEHHLRLAAERLRGRFPTVQFSSVWRSPAVGAPGPDFLNAAARLETALSPTALKFQILRPLEADLGRVRSQDRNAPRVIDLDVLIHGNAVLDAELWEQAHLAVPLAELLPELAGTDGKRLSQIAVDLQTSQPIEKSDLHL